VQSLRTCTPETLSEYSDVLHTPEQRCDYGIQVTEMLKWGRIKRNTVYADWHHTPSQRPEQLFKFKLRVKLYYHQVMSSMETCLPSLDSWFGRRCLCLSKKVSFVWQLQNYYQRKLRTNYRGRLCKGSLRVCLIWQQICWPHMVELRKTNGTTVHVYICIFATRVKRQTIPSLWT
jgi:hypothetical protein